MSDKLHKLPGDERQDVSSAEEPAVIPGSEVDDRIADCSKRMDRAFGWWQTERQTEADDLFPHR